MSDGMSRPDAPGEMREGLTLERYAEVMAHVRHFPQGNGQEVLARLGLDGQRWESAVLAWTDALAVESAMEEATLSTRFGTTFAKTRARLKEERPMLRSLGLLPEEIALISAPVPSQIEPAPLIPPEPVATQVELPSYMLAESAPTHLPLAPAFVPLSAVPLPIHQPALHSGAHLGEPVDFAPFPTGIVFPAASASAPPAPSWMPVGMLKLVSVQGTQPSSAVSARSALPFEPAKSSQSALENALVEAVSFQGPAPGPTMDDGLGETMDLGSLRHRLKPELPFSPPSASLSSPMCTNWSTGSAAVGRKISDGSWPRAQPISPSPKPCGKT